MENVDSGMKKWGALVGLWLTTFGASASTATFAVGELPLNQWESLQVLADLGVSTIELPENVTEGDALFGADLNENGVRDDYEAHLLSNYEDPEWIAMGLLAAELWQKSLESSMDPSVDRKRVLQDSLWLEDCFYRLQQETQLSSPMLAYFNTDARKAEKRRNRADWIQSLSPSDLRLSEQSCSIFQSLFDRSQYHLVKRPYQPHKN